MKKMYLMVLVVLLLFGLAACGNQQPAAEQAEPDVAENGEADTGAWPAFDEKIYIGVSIRSLANPYHVAVAEGAELFAEALRADGYDVEVVVLLSEGSDDKQISDIRALIARGGQNTVFYVDPNNAPNSTVIAELLDDAGIYWASVWNLAEGTYPMDFNYWVAHNSPDDVQAGYEIAVALFESFDTPGVGTVLALEGMLANTASQARVAGLHKALEEFPDVELLDQQPADWDMTIALNTTETWLSRFDDVDGIWAADDTMALGVVTALQNAGRNGEIGVVGVAGTPEAVEAILAGDMTATWDVNGMLQGFYVSAWALAAKLGVIDVATLPESDRMFLTAGSLITADNADSIGETPDWDYTDLDFFNIGPMLR